MLVLVALVLVLLPFAVLLALQNQVLSTGMANLLLERTSPYPGAEASVETLRLQGIQGIELEGFRVTRRDTVLLAADTLQVGLRPSALLRGRLHLTRVALTGVRVREDLGAGPREGPDAAPSPAPSPGDILSGRFYTGPSIRVDVLRVREVAIEPVASAGRAYPAPRHLGLAARDLELGPGFGFSLDSLSLVLPAPAGPGLRLRLQATLADGRFEMSGLEIRGPDTRVSGHASLAVEADADDPELVVALDIAALALEDLSGLNPGSPLGGTLQGSVQLRGRRLDALSGTVQAAMNEATVGEIHLGALGLEANLVAGRADLHGFLDYEGARLEVAGRGSPLDSLPTYELTARLDRLPARLPGLDGWENLARRVDPRLRIDIEGAGFQPATVTFTGEGVNGPEQVSLHGGMTTHSGLEWHLDSAVLTAIDVAHWAGDSTSSRLSGRVRAGGHRSGTGELQAAIDWELGEARYGSWALDRAEGRITVVDRRIQASLDLAGQGIEATLDSLDLDLTGDGHLVLSSLHIRGVDLARILGRPDLGSDLEADLHARASGFADAGDRDRLTVDGNLQLLASTFRDGRIQGGATRFHLANGNLSIETALETGSGGFTLHGSGRPLDSEPTFRLQEAGFRDLDLAGWGGPTNTRLTGTLSGEAQLFPEASAGVSRLSGVLRLALEPSVVGSVAVAGGDLAVTATEGLVTLEGSLGTVVDRARFTGRGRYDPEGIDGELALDLPLALLLGLAGKDSLVTEGALHLHAAVSGPDPGQVGIQAVLSGAGRIADLAVDSVLAVAGLSGGALQVDSILVDTNALALGGSGRLALTDDGTESALHVDVEWIDGGPLRTLAGADSVGLARGVFRTRLTGPASATRFRVEGSVESLVWNEVRLRTATLDASGTLDARRNPAQVSARATLARLYSPQAELESAGASLEYRDRALEFQATAVLDPTHRLDIAGVTTQDSAGTSVRLDQLDLASEQAAWHLARPAHLRQEPDRVAIDGLELRAGDGQLLVDGVVDRAADQDFRVVATSVDLDLLSVWFGREDLAGHLDGELTLTGPAAAPQAAGTLRVLAETSDGPAGTIESRLEWHGSEARLRASFVSPHQDSLALQVWLPIPLSLAGHDSGTTPAPSGEREVRVELRSDRFPLAELEPLLPPRLIAPLRGVLDADLLLIGKGESVSGRGSLQLTDGFLGIMPLGVEYREIEVRGRLEGNRLLLEQATARSGKGQLALDGEIRFVDAARVEPRLRLRGERFLFVDNSDMRFQASPDLTLEGTLTAPVVRGSVAVGNSEYHLTPQALAGTQNAPEVVLTTADVRMMEDTFGYQGKPRVSPMQDLFEAADLDLTLSLARDNWVRKRNSPRLALEVTGEVRARKEPGGDLRLDGRLAPVPGRGYFEQFGRTFEFAGGEVLLNGLPDDHQVDILTEYKVRTPGDSGDPEVVIQLEVRMQYGETSLTLSSEPPLSETEIVSYISTGHGTAGPGAGGATAVGLASEFGLSQVTGALQDVVQQSVGLDVFQVRYDAQQGATLVAGRYIDPRLYVGFRQPVQYQEKSDSGSQNPYQTVVEVEYEAYRWLMLNLQGETSRVRSFLRARHEY